jgi:hypothetical protein
MSTSIDNKPKRKKLFKGLVRRKSKKSEESPPTAGQTTDSSSRADDESTVYSVAFDATSKVSSGSSMIETQKTPLGDPIHVILLLMDPKTRRFELLQLEFDSNTAKVDDVFSQIAISATEPTLRTQKYESLCNLVGEELKSGLELAEYIDTAGIVIAVPATSEEDSQSIAKMATPILSNPKVHTMLSSSGLEITDLPPPAEKKTPPTPIKEVPTPAKAPVEVEEEEEKVEEEPEAVVEEEEEEKPVTRSAPPTAVVEPTPPVVATPKYVAPVEKKSGNNFIVMGAIFAVVFHLVMKTNLHFTSPLGPGLVLENGRERGACGLLSLSPFSDCESAIAKMEDGVFSVTKGDEVVFAISGPACGDAEDCVDGLVIGEDGKITIGGKKKVKVLTRAQIDITPWPFSEDVVLPKNML